GGVGGWGVGGGGGGGGGIGPSGPQGSQGPPGAGGVSGYEVVQASTTFTPPATGVYGKGVTCPSGKRPLGGGYFLTGDALVERIENDYPTFSGWLVNITVAWESSPTNATLTVYAICANVA